MSGLVGKIKEKVKNIMSNIPGLLGQENYELSDPEDDEPCPICDVDKETFERDWPDDVRKMDVIKDNIQYAIKLDNIHPSQWKLLGRNLLNIAYKDPDYGEEDSDQCSEDELPPPPEPSEALKKETGPLIDVDLKNCSFYEVEELGEMFYEMADNYEAVANGEDPGNRPTCGYVTEDEELADELLTTAEDMINDERTVNALITVDDVLPGYKQTRYSDPIEQWFDKDEPYDEDTVKLLDNFYAADENEIPGYMYVTGPKD